MEWQAIETVPKDRGVLLLAYAPDPPRMMIWDAALLATAMMPDTPAHLRFAATHWMVPTAPDSAKE